MCQGLKWNVSKGISQIQFQLEPAFHVTRNPNYKKWLNTEDEDE